MLSPREVPAAIFYDLANSCSSAMHAVQNSSTGTTPPVAEYTRVPRTSKLQALDTLPVTCNVSSGDYLILIMG